MIGKTEYPDDNPSELIFYLHSISTIKKEKSKEDSEDWSILEG